MNRSQDSLIGKTILVVGVTGFIGAAVACRHAAGASVIGVSRSPPKSQTCKRGGELFHLLVPGADVLEIAGTVIWKTARPFAPFDDLTFAPFSRAA